MPTQRISHAFKDISATFQKSPINDDLIILKNTNAIARSIRNLVLTIPGEKPFQPDIGSNVSQMLFENMDNITAISISDEIKHTIYRFEPRVNVYDIDVSPDYDNHQYNVTIKYEIIGIDVDPQQLSFVLQLTR